MFKLKYNFYRGADRYISFQSNHTTITFPVPSPWECILPGPENWQALVAGEASISLDHVQISSVGEQLIFKHNISQPNNEDIRDGLEIKINKNDCLQAIEELVKVLTLLHDPKLFCNNEMCGHAGFKCKKCKTIASISSQGVCNE